MSLIKTVLNPYLRLTEKRHLARATVPETLRRSFEIKARLFFWPPRGAVFRADRLGGVPGQWACGRGVAEDDQPLILYFHGGGYIFGSSRTHRSMLARLSSLCGCPAFLPDYRMGPEHAFPAAVDDALAVYDAVKDRPGGVILGGDSAGGGLALSALSEILRMNLAQPAGAFLFSPLTDMTCSGRSITANANADVILPATRSGTVEEMYLQGADPTDPRASPLFADFPDAPPVWLTVGDTEILLDDTRRMADRLREQGVDVTEVIERDLPHVWPIFQPFLPEAVATLRAVAAWIGENGGPPVTPRPE